MDFITGLPLSKKGNDALLVVLDSTSKRIRLIPCNITVTASSVAKLIFEHVVRNHGLPHTILHDLDPRFVAKVWKVVWEMMGTYLIFTPSYHPISNSANERSHHVIEDALRSYVIEQDEWDEHIPAIEFTMNNHQNIDTGRTPFELDTGQHPLNPATVLMQQQAPFNDMGVLHNWNQVQSKALMRYTEAQERRLKKINQNRVVPDFKKGD